MRIGVNAGSLEKSTCSSQYGEPCPDAMVDSALYHVGLLEKHGFDQYKISVKASDVFMSVRGLSETWPRRWIGPLHIGITEAGSLLSGTVKSSIGLGNLLWSGIGDTIRVSLSSDPVDEVKVGFEMLEKSSGCRHRGVTIISCPSCARQGFGRH